MQHFSFTFDDEKAFKAQVTQLLPEISNHAQSVLVQIYTNQVSEEYLRHLSSQSRQLIPLAKVIGCTTFGEICHGAQQNDTSVASISVFTSTVITTYGTEVTDDAKSKGKHFSQQIVDDNQHLKGIMLLTTPLSINSSDFLAGLATNISDTPIFGGGAADYLLLKKTLVIHNDDVYCNGAVMVSFSGKQLHIDFHDLLGWLPFGKEMEVTRANYHTVYEIDHKPAVALYKHYFDIEDSTLLQEALSFPLLLNRDDKVIARVPLLTNDEGNLVFLADIHKGDKVRFGFGDINTILEQVNHTAQSLREFQPEGIFQFSCGCRRLFFEEDICNEIAPFEDIATTVGFFTYGELCYSENKANALNASLLLVGMKEGETDSALPTKSNKAVIMPKLSNPNLVRIMHFISQVTTELQDVNKELMKMATYDGLTNILNRSAFDKLLEQEVVRSERYQHDAAIILMDIDHFKSVNDNYGHQTGDSILIDVANIVSNNIRECDVFARYGGEEFILLLPETPLAKANEFAERLRMLIETETQIKQSDVMPCITSSFGVAPLCSKQPNPLLSIKLADQALYKAKNAGRNTVKYQRLPKSI